MAQKKALIGERHHWWPMSLSKHWTDDNDLIACLWPDGTLKHVPPINAGVISNGHNILLDNESKSGWSFEDEFSQVDRDFPNLINTLDALRLEYLRIIEPDCDDYLVYEYDPHFLDRLLACIASLVIRSPQYRSQVVNLLNLLTSYPRSKKHTKSLIAANLMGDLDAFLQSHSGRGKFVLFFSEEDSFSYGDGTYNNVTLGGTTSTDTRLLIPLTPCICVLYFLPFEHIVEPRLLGRRATRNAIDLVNLSVKVASKDCLYFRGSHEAALSDIFSRREHLRFADDDPIEDLFRDLPGIEGMGLPSRRLK